MSAQLRPGYKRTEVGVIPEEWEVKPLHMLSDKIMVGIASAATHAYRDRGVVMFRNQNIKPGYLDDSDVLYIAEDYEETFRNKRLKSGDLLTARTGYPGTTSIVPSHYQGAQSFTTLITRPRSGAINSEYLCIFINSESGQSYFEQNQIGGGQKNVNAASLKNLPIAFPPTKSEQKSIVDALTDADALIESLEQLVTKKRQIKQGAMQELLTGEKRLPGFSGKWKVTQLGDCLLENPSYGINAPAAPYSDRLPVYLRITDISDDGRFATPSLVSVDDPNAGSYYLDDGDLVFARTGASVGKSYRYNPDDGALVFAGFLIRVRPDPSMLNCSFLAEFVKTVQYWTWVGTTSMRSGQPGINGMELASMPIPLPSLQEQTAIATVLSDMDAEIVGLESEHVKIRNLKQGMMRKLLTGEIRLI